MSIVFQGYYELGFLQRPIVLISLIMQVTEVNSCRYGWIIMLDTVHQTYMAVYQELGNILLLLPFWDCKNGRFVWGPSRPLYMVSELLAAWEVTSFASFLSRGVWKWCYLFSSEVSPLCSLRLRLYSFLTHWKQIPLLMGIQLWATTTTTDGESRL